MIVTKSVIVQLLCNGLNIISGALSFHTFVKDVHSGMSLPGFLCILRNIIQEVR